MANKLKHFRVAAGLTQTAVAKAVGVTQPTYQRWETGSTDIPEVKIVSLATALGATKEALMGKHPPVAAAFYDDSAPEDLQYYGEVAIHFHGRGEPLLLSISEEARSRLFQSLHVASKFFTVRDLANRTVAVRRAAISDLYLSSEAYDDYGPEHHDPGYKHGTPVQLPDSRDWEIIECLAGDSVGIEEFADEDVERVRQAVSITDQQYEKLIAEGHIVPEYIEAEKERNARMTDEIFEMATSLVYQLSTGQRRSVGVLDCELYEALSDLMDESGENFDESALIILQSEGYDRAVFINPDAVDYISVPTHLMQKSRDEVSAAILDDLGEDRVKRSPRGGQKVHLSDQGLL